MRFDTLEWWNRFVLLEARVLVIAGAGFLEGIRNLVGRLLTLGRSAERRVVLEKMDSDTIAVGRPTVPGARLRGEAERFLAEAADLGRRHDPRRATRCSHAGSS